MPEALPSVVAKDMLNRVLSLAGDEGLAWGFKDELKSLEESLELVQALQSDAAANKNSQLKAVQLWLKKLDKVASDGNVVFDKFTYETLRQKVEITRKWDKVLSLFSPSKNPLSFRLKMAHKIRKIKKSLDEIYKEGTKIGLIKLEGATDTTVDQLTHPYVDDSVVVGRDDDVSKIIDMLCCSDNEKHLSVMAIVGMGGQGKTTLAMLVFKHDKVVKHFDKTIWVCVSDDFEVERLLNEMVQSLTGTNPHLSTAEAIIKNLGEILKGKRYLLVLDDVWCEDEDKWDCMRKALLGISASNGSKIMVTTRSQQVASTMQASLTHQLRGLSVEDSWDMFKHRAFVEGGAVVTDNLVVIGRQIVKRCAGLPLAIKALGGLMYSKKSEPEWRSIQTSQLWDLEDNTGQVLPTLMLSYDHLTSSLKHCFAFCSIFPKDYLFEKSNLIQLWMALGFLNPPKNRDLSMECVGNKYFETLFFNSLLQDAEKDEYNYITGCKMHDVVHDLALYKSYNYCSITSQLNGDSDIVHLSLISSLREIPENSQQICWRLQTLILQGGFDAQLLANFKCLRVLVLDDDSITELPYSIEKLKQLKYLDISKTRIFSLPNSITKLYNLQTLRLKKVCEVPKNFGNLINLRHFCIDDISKSADCMFIGIGQLTHLQTLPFFVVNRDRGCHIMELGSLKNLSGDFTIFGLEHVENSVEAKIADLSKKSHLRALTLCWANHSYRPENQVHNDEHVLEGLESHSNLEGLMIKNFAGGKFPSWMMVESQPLSILKNLVKFKLENCNECERIPPLGHLQHLKVVEIIGMKNVKVIGTEFYGKHTGGGGASSSSGAVEVPIFPSLRELTLKEMPKLERWLEAVHQQSGSTNVFPCLEKLNITSCSSLALREMSRKLTSLTTLYLAFVEGSEFQSVVAELLVNNRSLRKLSIVGCDGFSYLPNTPVSDLYISGCPNLSCLPNNLVALERLELDNCNNLSDIPCLPSVREVSISGCEKLIGLPSLTQTFPRIEELSIEFNMIVFTDMHCHTSLRRLRIYHCERLTSLPELGTTLEELCIVHCPAMVSFPDFRYLKKLELIRISVENDYFPWPSTSTYDAENADADDIQCLQHVELQGWPRLKSLPEQLQHLSALTYLKLRSFHGLESLPEWLGNLSSLQSLFVYNWKNLKYMPSVEAMRRLTNLSELEINNCPLLKERCTQGSRPEWEKISHITTIGINEIINKK